MHVARTKEGRSAFKMFTDNPTGTRPLGRLGLRWECNIRIDVKEMCVNTRNLIDLAQDKNNKRTFVNATLNLRSL